MAQATTFRAFGAERIQEYATNQIATTSLLPAGGGNRPNFGTNEQPTMTRIDKSTE